MLVALTGGTGFVGSHTVVALQQAGHRVRALVRDPAKLKRIYEPMGRKVEEVVVGDMTDPDSAARLLDGCDALVHAAAIVALEASRAREVYATNTRGVELLVGGAADRGQRVVYVSSAGALFTRGSARITSASPIGETRGTYGASKAEAERYVRALQDRGASILTTYPTAVVGPDDPSFTHPNLGLRIFLKWAGPLTSTGYQPIDVRDLASMHLRLIEGEPTTGRYIAAGPYFPWPDLLDEIDRVTGRRVRRIRISGALLRGIGRIADVAKRVVAFDLPLTHEAMLFGTCWPIADGSAAQHELGMQFRSIEETLSDTYRWMHQAGHLSRKHIGDLAAARRG
ncbi:MAG: NAD-dependent epimerase/dehydratase family protein [Myxococcota bacterium]|nr:NAD-dependent epimerase/dehydratase family protein [Myxococcota bacterium]